MPMAPASDKKQSQEIRRLADWRKNAWLALGWNHAWASFLAETQVDIHTADVMLSKGASHDQVVRILAGFGPLGHDPLYDWDKHDRLMLGDTLDEQADDEQIEADEEHVAVAAGDTAVGKD